MIDWVSTFVFFFAVIDPIGTIPLFLIVTQGFDDKAKRSIAIRATVVSAIVLVAFVVGGELTLNAMGIPLFAFQIAGGLVLFLFALTMIFQKDEPEQSVDLSKKRGEDLAVFPLAIPGIAGPGAMLAAVLRTQNQQADFSRQAQTTAVMLVMLGITLVLMLLTSRLTKLLGRSGMAVISQIMGLIMASIAVNNVLRGIAAFVDAQGG